MDAIAELRDVFLGQVAGVDGVVKVDGDVGGLEEPAAGAKVVVRADQAHGDDWNA